MTDDIAVDLSDMPPMFEVNGTKVKVAAGTPLRAVTHKLADASLALPNQGDIDHQSLAGAVSTATHGTGRHLGAVATCVSALEIVTPNGEVVAYRKGEHSEFDGAVVALGTLGVVTSYELDVMPAYQLEETLGVVAEADALDTFFARCETSRHYELFMFPQAQHCLTKTLDITNSPTPGITQRSNGLLDDAMLWFSTRLGRVAPSFSGMVQRQLLKIASGDTRHGYSHNIFPSERRVRFEEMEYAIPLDQTIACVHEILTTMRSRHPNVAFPLELRMVAADDFWLSPFYGQARCTLSIHDMVGGDWKALFATLEPIFWRYGAVPHWGKRHSLRYAELHERVPRFGDFVKLRTKLDPSAKMLSPALRPLFLPS